MAARSASPEARSGAPLCLVVDDEAPIRDLVRGYLQRNGIGVVTAADGLAALDMAREHAPDVVVLDLMLPGLDGLEVCRRLRTFSDAYVVMLTARGDEVDRVIGLGIGADDYLVKPFSPRELVARIRALLRRPRHAPLAATPAGLELDVDRREVRVRGRRVELTPLEFALLAALAGRPGAVLDRQQLLDQVWGIDFVGDDHILDVHVGKLRRKLGDDATTPHFVETVRGVGFRLIDR